MHAKLPPWVEFGSLTMAFSAGCVNINAVSGLVHIASTHQTGNVTSLLLALSQGNTAQALRLSLVILAFLAGTIASGWIIRGYHLKLGRRYGVSIILQAGCIAAALLLSYRDSYLPVILLAASAGLQNAMATTYSGAVIRTTHLTGLLTDIGIMFGQRLGGIPFPQRKLQLLLSILAGFSAGCVVGAFGYRLLGITILLVPIGIKLVIGVSYLVYRKIKLTHPAEHVGHEP